MKINLKKFNFNFFLSDRKTVNNLEIGAIEHGGATKINGKVYSNIQKNDFIITNELKNTLSVYVPSTFNTNEEIDNSKYIQKTIDYLQNIYTHNTIEFENTLGSWYSEDLKKVVYDNITIVSVNLNSITENDIENFILISKILKYDMCQEGVSISINNALAIV